MGKMYIGIYVKTRLGAQTLRTQELHQPQAPLYNKQKFVAHESSFQYIFVLNVVHENATASPHFIIFQLFNYLLSRYSSYMMGLLCGGWHFHL